MCARLNLSGWRQSSFNLRRVKKLFNKARKLRYSSSKYPVKKRKYEKIIKRAYKEYINTARFYLDRIEKTLETLLANGLAAESQLVEIERYIAHGRRQIDQVDRRVLKGETIPHDEKVFSIFEEHTEWICKGKAGVPVELGLKVCVLEDQFRFILHHRVMQKESDANVAAPMVKEAKKRFPDLSQCSYDKGFHSPKNQEELGELLESVVLPKKGRLSKVDKEKEYSEDFRAARRQHSAVESAINALEVHGLDRCPDRRLIGFKRYVALAVVSRNIQRLGVIIREKEKIAEERLRKRAA